MRHAPHAPHSDLAMTRHAQVTGIVRGKLHNWDPVLSEYIRLHLYGDVYR